MNTFVYPVSQNLLSAVREQIDSGKDCEPGHAGPLCLRAAPPLDRLNAGVPLRTYLGYFQDRSTDDRVFHVPLIGLNSDRNWFWLINVAGSFLLYTLIRGALQKYQQLAQYLFNENKQDTTRVVLLNTTQIMTSGDQPADRGGRIRAFSFWDEYFAIRCLLLMPIMVSMTIVFDWLDLLCHGGWQRGLPAPICPSDRVRRHGGRPMVAGTDVPSHRDDDPPVVRGRPAQAIDRVGCFSRLRRVPAPYFGRSATRTTCATCHHLAISSSNAWPHRL